MLPPIRDVELNAGERRAVERLLQVPALWPFQILAGYESLGLDGALRLCLDPSGVTEDHRRLLRALGYTPEHLPAYEDILAALWGCRLRALRDGPAPKQPLEREAATLGLTLPQLHEAIRVWWRYRTRRDRGITVT